MARAISNTIADDNAVTETLDGGPIVEIKITETGGSHNLYVHVPVIHGTFDSGNPQDSAVLIGAGEAEFFACPDSNITDVILKNASAGQTPGYRIEVTTGVFVAE